HLGFGPAIAPCQHVHIEQRLFGKGLHKGPQGACGVERGVPGVGAGGAGGGKRQGRRRVQRFGGFGQRPPHARGEGDGLCWASATTTRAGRGMALSSTQRSARLCTKSSTSSVSAAITSLGVGRRKRHSRPSSASVCSPVGGSGSAPAKVSRSTSKPSPSPQAG